ncbi:hypothetical protein AGMMS49992_30410 [Clostridia bacterium]|nr:hypothetical protein AGMMS49992_30410 [Clostridia bacterium]
MSDILEQYSTAWRNSHEALSWAKSMNVDATGIEEECPVRFLDLPADIQCKLLDWIEEKIIRINSVNNKHTSYGLKHIFSSDSGIYVTNGQYKGAMIVAGHIPNNPASLNHVYKISEKSPALRK